MVDQIAIVGGGRCRFHLSVIFWTERTMVRGLNMVVFAGDGASMGRQLQSQTPFDLHRPSIWKGVVLRCLFRFVGSRAQRAGERHGKQSAHHC